jgi:hypothetical protein
MSDWTKFATAHYRKTKKSNPAYKFSNALKDAAALFKRGTRVRKTAKRGRGRKSGKKSRGGAVPAGALPADAVGGNVAQAVAADSGLTPAKL